MTLIVPCDKLKAFHYAGESQNPSSITAVRSILHGFMICRPLPFNTTKTVCTGLYLWGNFVLPLGNFQDFPLRQECKFQYTELAKV